MIMLIKKQKFNLLFVLSFLLAPALHSQVDSVVQKYRDEPKGNSQYRRKAVMDGNLVRTLFRNDSQIGSWPDRPSGEWPIGTGHNYIDGSIPIISSRVETKAGFVHPAETSYREEVDVDPVTGKLWVMEPVPGYVNLSSSKPAMSVDSASWPLAWSPALNLTNEWNGHWYGYFGRDMFNADLEIFYVMDDSQDKEYSRTPYLFYPVLTDSTRGGLGLRVETRGFQWSEKPFDDIVFWHYDVINISDFDRDSTIFGFYFDTGVGGVDDNGDDKANYNKFLDIVYAFDYDGIAPPGNWKTGYVAYAFLESPGNAFNGIDDDEDGMIDEKRDDGIDNDGDWIAYTDLNGNGKWDASENEPLNNDVGEDGVGPLNQQYEGPDKGEGDGIPTNEEPNFDKTDKDESDQIGLTSLKIDRLDNKGPFSFWPRNDEYIWNSMLNNTFDTLIQRANIHLLLGSGSFSLKIGKREKYSMALIFGENLEDIFDKKNSAQTLYNNDYRLPDSLSAVNENNFDTDPNHFNLQQNYPNPFNPSTRINWESSVNSWQTLKIYDVLGNEVATLLDEWKEAGNYSINFDANKLSSGVYFYTLRTGDFIATKKLILMK